VTRLGEADTQAILVAPAALARRQARWIAAIEPWRSLGYGAVPLGRWLARQAGAGEVRIWRPRPRAAPAGVIVIQKDVLLGWFVSLLAVRPEAAGRGIGTALLRDVASDAFGARRWLYLSCDEGNTGALGFYRKLGFKRVGRLPDLVRVGRVELLLRVGREVWTERIARRDRHREKALKR